MFRMQCLLALLSLAPFSSVYAAVPNVSSLALDVLGRPLPWGAEVRGVRLSLHMTRSRLRYGEIIEVLLDAQQRDAAGALLRLHFGDDNQTLTASVELRDEQGRPVHHRLQVFTDAVGPFGDRIVLRLWPVGEWARGRYFAPGSYQLRVCVECRKDPADPLRWRGRVLSNPLTFQVFAGGPVDQLLAEPLRKRATAFIQDLDVDDFATREAAQQALLTLSPEILPLVDEALASASPQAAHRLERILFHLLDPLIRPRLEPVRALVGYEPGPLLAPLSAATWKRIQTRFPRTEFQQVYAASYGPVDSAAPERWARDLSDPDPAIRIRALRRVPRVTEPKVLRKLCACLADRYQLSRIRTDYLLPLRPVAFEAREALRWQGSAAIEPLIDLARSEDSPAARREAVSLLGELGPDPRSIRCLAGLCNTQEDSVQFDAVRALAHLGRPALKVLLDVVRDPRQPNALRRQALEGITWIGENAGMGPVLRNLLSEEDARFRMTVIFAVERLHCQELLPELKLLALDAGDLSLRSTAVAAYARMIGPKEAQPLLEHLLASPAPTLRGRAALLLAELEIRAAVPRLLDLLDDSNRWVRQSADAALRGLAEKPEGVGHDSARPGHELWQRWWSEHTTSLSSGDE